MRHFIIFAKTLSQSGGTHKHWGWGLGPAIQPIAPLLPEFPHHRVPSAPVMLRVERIQFMQKPSEHLVLTVLSLIKQCLPGLCQVSNSPLVPESKHCDSEPQKQLCRDHDINISVPSSATRVQKQGISFPATANICHS